MAGDPTGALTLTAVDLEMYERLGITPDLLREARVRRVTDADARTLLTSRHPGNLAGLYYPYIDPVSGRVLTCRVRRDHPEIEAGKPVAKYLAAYGDFKHLYFGPNIGHLLEDISSTVVI